VRVGVCGGAGQLGCCCFCTVLDSASHPAAVARAGRETMLMVGLCEYRWMQGRWLQSGLVERFSTYQMCTVHGCFAVRGLRLRRLLARTATALLNAVCIRGNTASKGTDSAPKSRQPEVQMCSAWTCQEMYAVNSVGQRVAQVVPTSACAARRQPSLGQCALPGQCAAPPFCKPRRRM
jgi:hypothetical protein